MDLIDALDERDIRDEMIAAIRQGSALSPASWGLEVRLSKKSLIHADQPMMDWCVTSKTLRRSGR